MLPEIKREDKDGPSRARVIAGVCALAACGAVLAWLWVFGGEPPAAAPAPVQSRAEEIAEKIRAKEAPEPPQALQPPGEASGGSGPKNLRQRPGEGR